MKTLREEQVLHMIYALIETPQITLHLENQRVQTPEIQYLESLLPTGFMPENPLPINATRLLCIHYSEVCFVLLLFFSKS